LDIKTPKGLKIRYATILGIGRRSGPGDNTVTIDASYALTVDFELTEDNQVSGRVLDPNGLPIKDVCVELELVCTMRETTDESASVQRPTEPSSSSTCLKDSI
jgi:hypothetical protein